MRRTPPLLLLPTLALGGIFSGTVLDLAGRPVPGATVAIGQTAVLTSSDGAWSLVPGSTATNKFRHIATPASSRLLLEDGHLRLTWNGSAIDGRRAAIPSGAVRASAPATARAAAAPETLHVYWKGKRLVVAPLTGDSAPAVLRIDTAWKDDAGIPWNPAITYGSLLDARDGQTYRSVVVGTQTWMAENLNIGAMRPAGLSSPWWDEHPVSKDCYGRAERSCEDRGGLYSWWVAMQLHSSYADSSESVWSLLPDQRQGVCPDGWHHPTVADWTVLVEQARKTPCTGACKTKGVASRLMAVAPTQIGIDLLGMRIVRDSVRSPYDADPWIPFGGFWSWSKSRKTWGATSTTGGDSVLAFDVAKDTAIVYSIASDYGLHVRCLKDIP